MKKLAFFVCAFALLVNILVAQENEDDIPYLTDEDWAALEAVLPRDDILTELVPASGTVPNEMSRLNAESTLYHLLILDRSYCPTNSDISGIVDSSILYKLKHGKNGYIIAIYTSPAEGPVFPILPEDSRVLVELITTRKNTIREYINSTAFSRFVTSRSILSQIQEVLNEYF